MTDAEGEVDNHFPIRFNFEVPNLELTDAVMSWTLDEVYPGCSTTCQDCGGEITGGQAGYTMFLDVGNVPKIMETKCGNCASEALKDQSTFFDLITTKESK